MKEEFTTNINKAEKEGDLEKIEQISKGAEAMGMDEVVEHAQKAIQNLKSAEEEMKGFPTPAENEIGNMGGNTGEIQAGVDEKSKEAKEAVSSAENQITELSAEEGASAEAVEAQPVSAEESTSEQSVESAPTESVDQVEESTSENEGEENLQEDFESYDSLSPEQKEYSDMVGKLKEQEAEKQKEYDENRGFMYIGRNKLSIDDFIRDPENINNPSFGFGDISNLQNMDMLIGKVPSEKIYKALENGGSDIIKQIESMSLASRKQFVESLPSNYRQNLSEKMKNVQGNVGSQDGRAGFKYALRSVNMPLDKHEKSDGEYVKEVVGARDRFLERYTNEMEKYGPVGVSTNFKGSDLKALFQSTEINYIPRNKVIEMTKAVIQGLGEKQAGTRKDVILSVLEIGREGIITPEEIDEILQVPGNTKDEINKLQEVESAPTESTEQVEEGTSENKEVSIDNQEPVSGEAAVNEDVTTEKEGENEQSVWEKRKSGLAILAEGDHKINIEEIKDSFSGDIEEMKDAFEKSKNGLGSVYDVGFVEAFVRSPNTSSRDILDFHQMLTAEAFPGITADMIDRNEGIKNMRNRLKKIMLESGKLTDGDASLI